MLCTGRKGGVLLCNFLALVAAACGATLGACVQYRMFGLNTSEAECHLQTPKRTACPLQLHQMTLNETSITVLLLLAVWLFS